MTEPGMQRILSFARGVWPAAKLSRETIHAWRLKLDRFDDDTAMQTLFALAETEQYMPALSQVYQRCVTTENRRQASTQREGMVELPLSAGITDDRPECTHPTCRCVLLPGFDPPGDHCRHHAPKHRDNQEPAA